MRRRIDPASGPDLFAEAGRLLPELSALRRDLHRHPELGGQERRTAAIIAERLRALGLEVRTGVAGTGVVGLLRGRAGPSTRTLALRADIDGLSVMEADGASYRSEVPGVSHACGHDGHTAIQLGAADLLCRRAERLARNVLFLFQPSEDTLPGGAAAMIRDGALDGAGAILSLHLNPRFPAGTVAVRQGWATTSSLDFRLNISGQGGHVAEPTRTVNPLLAAAALISSAEALRRELEREGTPMILAFGSVHAGTAANVIPETAELTGSVRAASPEKLEQAVKRFHEIARVATEPAGVRMGLSFEEGYPPVWNDPALTESFRSAAASVVGPTRVLALTEVLATGDDVAFFHREVPGVYWQLGTLDPDPGFAHPLHSPRFDFDEGLLAVGAAVQARAAMELAIEREPFSENRPTQ